MKVIITPWGEFVLNVEHSPEDKRDLLLEAIITEDIHLPEEIDYRPFLPSVRNQGPYGTCSAQTASCMKEFQERKDNNVQEHMSPQFIYNNRENQGSEGMYPRNTMEILLKKGSCLEKDYPYGKIEPLGDISPEAYALASEYKIKSYAKVDTIEGLKKALYTSGPCYLAVNVYNYGPRMWKPTPENNDSYGGHAMSLVGYTSEGFIVRNSWGSGFGDSGYCIFPYEDWGLQREVWMAIDIQTGGNPEPIDPVKPKTWWQKHGLTVIVSGLCGLGLIGVLIGYLVSR